MSNNEESELVKELVSERNQVQFIMKVKQVAQKVLVIFIFSFFCSNQGTMISRDVILRIRK